MEKTKTRQNSHVEVPVDAIGQLVEEREVRDGIDIEKERRPGDRRGAR
jgi:hypothetical protein